MKPLKVSYDKPEAVDEMIRWLVDGDTIELRDLALNLLDDVETLKAELLAVDRAGFRRAVEALRDRPASEGWLRDHAPSATVSQTELAALYLESIASEAHRG